VAKVSTSNRAAVDDVAARIVELSRLHSPLTHRSPRWLDEELTFSQMRILFMLSEQGPLTMSRLAEILSVTPATATGVIERLEKRGLVARSHRGDDRRIVETSLTERGAEMIRGAAGARLDMMREMLSVLTPEELGTLNALLATAVARLSERGSG
jgi:DNA-binding MarR family transcriptional regulator